tara:strand:- start:462 stop:629 length:168 start_codon:yes stop_codon:yes gene_type:complete
VTRPTQQAVEWEKLSTYVHKGLRRQLRAKSALEDKEVREVVTALIKLWLEGSIEL